MDLLQASRMDGDLGFMDIKPEHMVVLESILVMIFIPLCDAVIYPFLEIFGVKTPLQKMMLGGLCPAVSFILSGLLEMAIRDRKVHMLWQLPQHIFMALAEVLFAIPGLEFSFTQAPHNMKSVLMGFWHLTVALGNIITIFITGSQLFSSQVVEYFAYSGLMIFDMIAFACLAHKYKTSDI
jgi:POT family proton-dependent oligopeptide transporter